MMRTLRASIERCYVFNRNDFSNCLIDQLDVEDPTGTTASHFDYTVVPGANFYSIRADRNTYDGGSGILADNILLEYDDATGTVIITGSTAF